MQFKDLWRPCARRRDEVDADREASVQVHKWRGSTKVDGVTVSRPWENITVHLCFLDRDVKS